MTLIYLNEITKVTRSLSRASLNLASLPSFPVSLSGTHVEVGYPKTGIKRLSKICSYQWVTPSTILIGKVN